MKGAKAGKMELWRKDQAEINRELHRQRMTALYTKALQHAANGKSAKETGLIMHVSERTVENWIAEMIRTNGCINKMHLVAEALRNKLIN